MEFSCEGNADHGRNLLVDVGYAVSELSLLTDAMHGRVFVVTRARISICIV
jgi:hypothetical protein